MKNLFFILLIFSVVLLFGEEKQSAIQKQSNSELKNLPIDNNLSFSENAKEEVPYCQKDFFTSSSGGQRCHEYYGSKCGNGGVCYYGFLDECEVCFNPETGFHCGSTIY